MRPYTPKKGSRLSSVLRSVFELAPGGNEVKLIEVMDSLSVRHHGHTEKEMYECYTHNNFLHWTVWDQLKHTLVKSHGLVGCRGYQCKTGEDKEAHMRNGEKFVQMWVWLTPKGVERCAQLFGDSHDDSDDDGEPRARAPKRRKSAPAAVPTASVAGTVAAAMPPTAVRVRSRKSAPAAPTAGTPAAAAVGGGVTPAQQAAPPQAQRRTAGPTRLTFHSAFGDEDNCPSSSSNDSYIVCYEVKAPAVKRTATKPTNAHTAPAGRVTINLCED